MPESSFTLITTTINMPSLLEAYADDAKRFRRNLEEIVIVGDRKTPNDLIDFSRRLQKKFGISVRYMSPADQESYLSRFPAFREFLPWNCIQRRNVGSLVAFENGSDIIVTIDDDNFLAHPDYFGFHSLLGHSQQLSTISSQGGWFNVCDMLVERSGLPFYHRGHPLTQRWTHDSKFVTQVTTTARPVVNAGLWLDEPDIDAITRLCLNIQTVGLNPAYPASIATSVGTWAPFNSQNTGLLRELIPAYFLFPRIGRYDDIWASYVVRHISDHLGDVVTYGYPLVRQRRNPHNYLKDFDAERFGLENNDFFLKAIRSCELSSVDYRGCFLEIATQFPEKILSLRDEIGADVQKFDIVTEGFRQWASIFSELR